MNVHFLGIGGSGESAIAAIAQEEGFKITGCDKQPENEFTKPFKKQQLFQGHSPQHLITSESADKRTSQIDMLVITPAIESLDPHNPELEEAKKLNIPILTWQEFMGKYLEKDKFVIAICGTHGKSTTTAMVGKLLEDTGLDPTVELGAIAPEWGKNYRVGKSKYFVTEADEFHDNFLVSKPNITIVTNIEMDHPEYFKDFEEYKQSYIRFLSSTRQTILANLQDPNIAEVLKVVMKQSPVSAVDYTKTEIDFKLKIPGKHNITNALAVFQLGLLLDIDPYRIKKSLESYDGLDRRFECVGKWKGALVYSDFGHHPTEIKVTLQAFREKFPDKELYVIFQPHMFSRTKALFNDFVRVLTYAPVDIVYVTDIYPSREVDTGLVSSEQLVEAIKKHRKSVEYISPRDLQYLKDHPELISEDLSNRVFINLGAGDIDEFARELVKKS